MNNTEGVLGDLHRLRELGISIAMDDFGTGYSSLAYLWRFPFDKLKIDRSFITDLETNPKVSEIVQTIISLGRTLNLSVTAEGIETLQQADALTDQGCELGQGFFLGRPLAASDLPHQPPRAATSES
jgi:EAL domain-containing protein (putative c-di-GMP-specific phosphodiesterase class I)